MSAPAPSSSLLGLGLRIAAGSAGWYAVSVSLTLFNKWILGYWVPSFRFPLAMTFCHMVFKGVIAAATIWLFALPVPTITWRQFWLHACPIGAATGLDIALSNVSFLYITVSYYTMIKPLGLLFTLLMALLLRLEQPSVALISAVMLIFSGVFLASVGETNDCSGGGDASSLEACELTGFTYIPANSSSPPCDDGTVGGCAAGVCSGGGDASSREACERTGHRFRESTFSLVGFLCVLGATVFGAIRWTVTQLMLQQHRQQQQQQQQRRQVAKGRPTAIAGGRQMPGGGKGSQQASSVCREGLEAEETGGEAGAGAGGGLNVSSGSEEGEDPELQPLTGGAGAAAKGLAASTGLAKFPPPVPSSSMQGPAPAPGPPPPPPPRAAAVGLLDGGAVSLLMLISPAASLTLVPLVVARELADLQTFLSEEPTPVVAQALAFVVLASFLAFLLLMFELYVINLSSSLSLNIIGTFKEMVTIAVAVGVFGDTVTSLNLVGVLVTVLGILAYNLQRLRGRRRREEGNGVAAAYTPMVHEQEAEAEGDDEKEEASRGGAAPSSASPHGPQRSRP